MNIYLIIISIILYLVIGVALWIAAQYLFGSQSSDVAIDLGSWDDWFSIVIWPGFLMILLMTGIICGFIYIMGRIKVPKGPHLRLPRFVIRKGDPLT